MVKANRPPAKEESQEHIREQLKHVIDSDVQRAANILLDAGLSFEGISKNRERVDFLFPGETSSGEKTGIFLSVLGDDELCARVYLKETGLTSLHIYATNANEAVRWIGNPQIARTGEWARDLEIGSKDLIVINPIEDWRFDIQEASYGKE